MARMTSDARLFGIDIRIVKEDFLSCWRSVISASGMAWLTPKLSVKLFCANGHEQGWWTDGTRQQVKSSGVGLDILAVELPEDLVLRRSSLMPAMSPSDLEQAVRFQAMSASPFSEVDLVFGFRQIPLNDGRVRIDLVLASRKLTETYLQKLSLPEGRSAEHAPEVWILDSDGTPITIRGFGEEWRRVLQRRGRWLRYALVGVVGALLVAVALTPALQLRARAQDAYGQHQRLAQSTVNLVEDRAALMQATERLSIVSESLVGRVEPLRVLDRLTTILPDDTALQTFVLKGSQLTLTGLTANSSALMQVLGEQPGMRDVKAPSAAIRVSAGQASKENFVLELTLDPAVFGNSTKSEALPKESAAVAPDVAGPKAAMPPALVGVTPPAIDAPKELPPAAGTRHAPSFGGGGRSAPHSANAMKGGA